MLINQHISKSVISTLLDFSSTPPPPPPINCTVWFVFSSIRWAGYSTALASLLARKLTSVRLALVVLCRALPYCFESTYYTVLLLITLTSVSSLIGFSTPINFRNSFRKKKGILKVFTIFFHFSHQTIASFLITTTLMNKSGCFFSSIRFQL